MAVGAVTIIMTTMAKASMLLMGLLMCYGEAVDVLGGDSDREITHL
jgi:hypothetical protein